MTPKTEDQFRTELDEARAELERRDRQAVVGDQVLDEGGIGCDFELPYSSLPSIGKTRWN